MKPQTLMTMLFTIITTTLLDPIAAVPVPVAHHHSLDTGSDADVGIKADKGVAPFGGDDAGSDGDQRTSEAPSGGDSGTQGDTEDWIRRERRAEILERRTGKTKPGDQPGYVVM